MSKNALRPTTGEDFGVNRDAWGLVRDIKNEDLGTVSAEHMTKERRYSGAVETGKKMAQTAMDTMVNIQAGVKEPDTKDPSSMMEGGIERAANALQSRNSNLYDAGQHLEQNIDAYKAAAIEEANANGVPIDYNGKTYSYDQEQQG